MYKSFKLIEKRRKIHFVSVVCKTFGILFSNIIKWDMIKGHDPKN